MSNNYYYLISGLPDIALEDGKLTYSVAQFVEELDLELSQSDKKMIDIYRLKFDNENLLNYLKDKESPFNSLGHYDATDFESALVAFRDEEPYTDMRLPVYLLTFIEGYVAEAPLSPALSWNDQLAALYYDYAISIRSEFASQWFELNLNIGNILAAQSARKFGVDLQTVVVGNNETAVAIRTVGGRDFGLSGTIDYIDQLLRIDEEPNLYERERRIDLLRWKWLDDATFFHYFSVERVFAYLLRLEMIERWLLLNKEAGEQMFRRMIEGMKSSVEVPSEFI